MPLFVSVLVSSQFEYVCKVFLMLYWTTGWYWEHNTDEQQGTDILYSFFLSYLIHLPIQPRHWQQRVPNQWIWRVSYLILIVWKVNSRPRRQIILLVHYVYAMIYAFGSFMRSHACHSVLNHCQLKCVFFNNLPGCNKKTYRSLALIAFCVWNPLGSGVTPHREPAMQTGFSVSWCHHVVI